jgi:hypothetical protein
LSGVVLVSHEHDDGWAVVLVADRLDDTVPLQQTPEFELGPLEAAVADWARESSFRLVEE